MAELRADLAAGRVTSAQLVRAYTTRVERLDHAGPTLRSVLALNSRAQADARWRDAARRTGRVSVGSLDGIPLLIKDNVETQDPVATTAGSLALVRNVTGRDATLVARLRAAGAVMLGKANLSEWSNARSRHAVSGWSAVGGLTRNPYAPDRSACGSSSGSAVAVAASLAAAAVGTDTNGSVTCPAAVNGVVGLRPTLGFVSRAGVIPVSSNQDTPGPITRTVADAALLLDVMAGTDPADPATRDADARRCAPFGAYAAPRAQAPVVGCTRPFSGALAAGALRGRRLGVMRFALGPYDPATLAAFERALAALRAAGVEVVDVSDYAIPPELERAAGRRAFTDLRADLDAYLASTPPAVRSRSLADVITPPTVTCAPHEAGV
jgi:amidase